VEIKDKRGVIASIQAGLLQTPVILDVGCGTTKSPGSIGVDLCNYDNVDIVGDALDTLRHFPAASVDAIITKHFVEHVEDLEALLMEFVRVTRPGATIEIVAPHHSNPYFYSDPTHRRYFGLYTFCYFAASDLFSRKVPTYGWLSGVKLTHVDLVFKSTRPFFVRHGIKRVAGFLFNSCRYMRELYEEFFCFAVPCYEVKYRLTRTAETQ
jgi:ubiquinone/menaquinone biosynthesis C-methylase UbiE